MADPYVLTPEPGRPEEWQEIPHQGSGTPGFLTVEWDPVTNKVRTDGPVVQVKWPERPY